MARLAALNQCLSSFGPDPDDNIRRLVAFIGEQLEPSCALYNRLNGDSLFTVGAWNLPEQRPQVSAGEGQLYYEVLRRSVDSPVLLRHLPETPSWNTASIVPALNLQTCLGRAVCAQGATLGTLCLLYAEDHIPSAVELELLGIAASAIGIEETRRRTETARSESDERYRQVVELLPDAVLIHRQGVLLFANPAAAELFGAAGAEQLIGRPVLDLVHPEEREFTAEQLRRLESGAPPGPAVEQRGVTLDGRVIYLEVRAVAFPFQGERAIQAVLRDVGARRRAEESLRESESKFRKLAETLPLAIGILQGDRFVYVNRTSQQWSGYSEQELLKMPFWEIAHPDFRELLRTRGAARQEGQTVPSSYEVKMQTRDGEDIWMDVTLGLVEFQGGPAVLATGFDITERKRAEKLQAAVYQIAQATDQAASLEDLYARIHAIISEVMPAGNFYIALYDSEQNLVSFPYFVDEVDVPLPPGPPGHGLTEYVLRTGRSLLCTPERDEELRRAGEVELVGVPSPIWLGVPLRIQERTIGVMVVQHYRDAHAYGERECQMLEFVSSQVANAIERKAELVARGLAEDALLESEKRFRQLAENIEQAFWLRDLATDKIIYVSPGYAKIWGRPAESLYTEPQGLLSSIHPDDAAEVARRRAARAQGEPLYLEFRIIRPDGAVRWVASRTFHVLDAQGKVFRTAGIAEDITERKRVEIENARLLAETKRRAEELAAVYRTAQDLAIVQDPEAMLQLVLERATELLGAPAGVIYLYDPNRQLLEVTFEKGGLVAAGMRLELGEDLAGRAAETRQPILEGNAASTASRSLRFDGRAPAALAAVPLLHRGELIGVLVVAEKAPSPRRFTEQDIQLLTLLTDEAAGAIRNARLLLETRERARQLGLLYDAGLTLNSVLEPHAQLEFLFKIARRALHADRAEFFRYDPNAHELVLELGVGFQEEDHLPAGRIRFSIQDERGLHGWVYRHRVPLNVPDLHADPRYVGIDSDLKSGLWTPVEHEGELRGILTVLSTERAAFSAQDERLLVLFANQAAVALENARLYTAAREELAERHRAEGALRDKIATLQTLAEIDRQVMVAGSRDEIMRFVCARAAELLHAPKAVVGMADGDTAHVLASYGLSSPESAEEEFLQLQPLLLDRGREARRALSEISGDDPRLSLFREEEGIRSLALSPLLAADHVLGALLVFDTAARNWTDDERELLGLLAGQAAIALEKTRLVLELEESLSITTRLYRLSSQVLAANTFEETVRVITKLLREGMAADLTSIRLLDEQGKPAFYYGVGYPDGFDSNSPVRPDGLTMQAWRTGQPRIVADVSLLHPKLAALGVRSSIVIPLPGNGHPLGVLFVHYLHPHHFNDREVRVLELFANQTALALRHMRLLDETRRRAAELAGSKE